MDYSQDIDPQGAGITLRQVGDSLYIYIGNGEMLEIPGAVLPPEEEFTSIPVTGMNTPPRQEEPPESPGTSIVVSENGSAIIDQDAEVELQKNSLLIHVSSIKFDGRKLGASGSVDNAAPGLVPTTSSAAADSFDAYGFLNRWVPIRFANIPCKRCGTSRYMNYTITEVNTAPDGDFDFSFEAVCKKCENRFQLFRKATELLSRIGVEVSPIPGVSIKLKKEKDGEDK